MFMMTILRVIDRFFPPKAAYAHCDVPCGVYSRHPMQIGALAVVKMVEKILNPPERDEKDQQSVVDFHNNMTRFVIVKEQEAEKCKREVLILWTDFFKAEHLENWPDLHERVWKITKLCSENKRSVSKEKADELLKRVEELGDIFDEAQKAAK